MGLDVCGLNKKFSKWLHKQHVATRPNPQAYFSIFLRTVTRKFIFSLRSSVQIF